jgi:putative redox protein
MYILIDKLDSDEHMEAKNEEGGIIRMDGTRSIGEFEGGFSPMQLLLAGIGGCSAIDILHILKKQKQDVQDFKVRVDGDRQKKDTYSVFEKIHLHFDLKGVLEPKKVERAINLSLDKYCSVSKALEKSSTITHSYTINRIED